MPTKAETENEELKAQVETLKTDVTRLVSTLSGVASDRADRTVDELSAEVDRYVNMARGQIMSRVSEVERSVQRNPMQSLLIAIGLGFLVGAFMRR